MQKRNLRTGQILWFGCAAILIGVPFHALLTAWFASNFGYFDLIRLWKEFILLALAVSSIVILIRHPAIRRDLLKDRIVRLLMSFIVLILAMTIVGIMTGKVSANAALYGLIIDTRSFVFLLVLFVAGQMSPLPLVRRRWLLIPAVIVITIGLLQLFVLPANFLRHFGYGVDTLPSFQPIDNKPDFARVQSTLRGPNPLGAYLVPIIMSFVALAVASKKLRVIASIAVGAAVVVLFGTYSRSAAIGLAIAVLAFSYWSIQSKKFKQVLLLASVALLVIFGGITYLLRDNDTFQNIVFHTNEKSTSSSSSNTQRYSAISTGVKDIVRHPLGVGVGSAGPASVRNLNGGARISENYFLQIGQEAGVIGIVLFMGIFGIIISTLYARRSDVVVRSTLAALLGLIFINVVSHAWADDTLAYVGFALLGYALIKTSTKSENLDKL